MNWIQRHAMMMLLRHKTARVNDMRPQDVAANLFTYHLDGLVVAGMIEKQARGVYALTAKGLKLAGSMSTVSERVAENIKTVILLCGERDGKQLVFRWNRQPYLGEVTAVYDRLAYGASLQEGVATALRDKLGVGCDDASLRHLTSGCITIHHGEDIVSHMNALVYQVDITNVSLPFNGRNGEAFLADASKTATIEGLPEFFDQIHSDNFFDVTWRYE